MNEKVERVREESSTQEDDLKARSMKKVKTSGSEDAEENVLVDLIMGSEEGKTFSYKETLLNQQDDHVHPFQEVDDAELPENKCNTSENGVKKPVGTAEADTAMDSDTAVVVSGNVEANKESEIISPGDKKIPDMSQSVNGEKEKIMENPFGPWMLVKRFPRNKERGGQRGNNSRGDSGNRNGQAVPADTPKSSGSRFNALIEEEEGNLVEGIITEEACMLHGENAKENRGVIDVGPVGSKKEVLKEIRVRNNIGGKNPQNRGPRSSSGPFKTKSRGESSNSVTTVQVLNPPKTIDTPPTIEQTKNNKSNLGLEKEIMARMRILEKNGGDFLSRFATSVHLPSKEEIAIVHSLNIPNRKEVPPDLNSSDGHQTSIMEEDTQPMAVGGDERENVVSHDVGSKNQTCDQSQ
ncbi:hypothetical protein RIF29_21302 [Crotalaria pallida]|uniref:Uncharacterized protein n=1 Tax=Crotalaria pallida TaxID=3830 RepID=A0AAN9IDA0_CROPI